MGATRVAPARAVNPSYPPPAGPPLVSLPEEAAEPSGPRGPDRAPDGPVDWWGWQAEVRAAVGPSPAAARPVPPHATRGLPGIVLGVLVTVGIVGTLAGGVVYGGRPSDAAPAHRGVRATGAGAATGPSTVAAVAEPVTELPRATEPAAPPPPPAPTIERPSYPVARLEVDLVDPTRPAVVRASAPEDDVDAAGVGGRALRAVIRFPDVRTAGPFPLVVFAHGYATSTAAYAALLDDLAAAGYVVAAPELPLTSTALPGPVGARDAAAQVGDVSFVISSVLDLVASDGPLQGAVRAGPVGVVGHSDGGITAAGVAFASRVRDPRVTGAVVLSGAQGDFGGAWFPAGSPALLAIHGDADAVNPFFSSQSLYSADRSGSARYLVRVRGGGHTDAFSGDRTRPALVALVDDFLRAALGGDAAAADRIPGDASVPGVLELAGA
ncbi:MAG: hypothetical protein WDA60_19190 [Acidimicrobiia bacterium]